MCSALMHLFHLLFVFKQPIMCVCVLLGEHHLMFISRTSFLASTLQNRDQDTNSYLLLLHLSLFLFRCVGWFPSQHVDPVVGGQNSPDSEDHNYSCGSMTIACATLISVSLTATVPTHRMTKLTRGGRGRRKALL